MSQQNASNLFNTQKQDPENCIFVLYHIPNFANYMKSSIHKPSLQLVIRKSSS